MGKNSQSRWKHCCALIGKVTGKHDRCLSRGMISCWSWFLRQLVWWIVGTKRRDWQWWDQLWSLAVDTVVMLVWDELSAHWLCVHGSCAQQCLTLCDSVDYSLPGSSVHGVSQARMLECVAIFSSKGSSWLRGWTLVSCVSCIAGGFFTRWAFGVSQVDWTLFCVIAESCKTWILLFS